MRPDVILCRAWRAGWRQVLGCLVAACWLGSSLAAEPGGTGARRDASTFDVGYGVLATPMSVIGELLRRDRILVTMGRSAGVEFRLHPYEKGADTLAPMLEGKLHASMPTDVVALNLIGKGDVQLVGYVRQSFSSVIGPRQSTMADLRGKRIGNATGTSGHNTLLQGLAGVGLSEKDVVLVEMPVRDMPAALLAGRIDAFAAFEPTPSALLRKAGSRYKALHRQISPAYLVVARQQAAENPEAARLLIAALHRAVRWMGASRGNLESVARWTLASMERFTGNPSDMTFREIAQLTQTDLLHVAGVPHIPKGERLAGGALSNSFEFLQKAGKLPPGLTWQRVAASIDPVLTERVMTQARHYRLNDFDYDTQ